MRNFIKVIFWALGGLFVLAFVAIAAFALLFDPNAFRDDITRLVEKKTGRALVIEGDLNLSFYPWLGFAAGQTTLSNPNGFPEAHMLTFDNASASVRLLPLLKRRIELSRVTLDGVTLNLHRNADGSTNWDDLTGAGGPDSDAEAQGAGGFSTDGIGGIYLTGAKVAYVDEQAGTAYSVRDLDLRTGVLRPRSVFPLEAKGYVVSADPGVEGAASVEGEVQVDTDGKVYLAKPRLEIEARGESVPGERMTLKLSGLTMTLQDEVLSVDRPKLIMSGTGNGDPWTSLEATLTGDGLVWTGFDTLELAGPGLEARVRSPDLITGGLDTTVRGQQLRASVNKETMSLAAAVVETLGLTITSPRVDSTAIFDDMTLAGRIDIAEFSLRKTLAAIGMTDIQTADPDVLSTMRVSGDAYYGPDAMRLRNLSGTLDQTALSGSVALLSNDQMQFDLVADTVNIDRYRSPSETGGSADSAASLNEITIPVEELRALSLDGKLRVGSMQLVGLKSTDVRLSLAANGGDVRVYPVQAALYDGTYNGDIRLDVRGGLPRLSLNERLDNVQFGPFSKDLMDANRLSGTLNGRITVAGAGLTAAAITASANGDGAFVFKDGAYEGTDIWYRVRQARAVLKGGNQPTEADQKRTRFADLSGTATIVDGVMRSNDIAMVLPFMKVSGQGTLALLSQEMDFRFKGDIVDRPDLTADVNDLVGITVPFKITGTVSAPSVGVDMQAVLADIAKRKLAERLGLGSTQEDQTAAAQEGVDAEKEELKDKLDKKLKDKLKGLLGGGGN